MIMVARLTRWNSMSSRRMKTSVISMVSGTSEPTISPVRQPRNSMIMTSTMAMVS